MSIRFGRYFAATAISSAALVWALPAVAQDADEGEAASTSAGSGEIIVTARRREEALQDTPVAITAINTQQLENTNTLNIGDIQGLSPNLLITNQNSGASAANLSIRGLTYADVEKSAEPTVGVVVDGVFIGTSTGQYFDFFDIEQLEVLRGPQGTLFGRNTIGGVINIRRTKPTGEFGVKAEASYGRYDTLATRAVVNIPIVEGRLATKFFYFHNESDGYYVDYLDGRPRGGSNNENFGMSILITDDGPFEAIFTAEKQVQSFEPINASITRTGELFCGFAPADQCNRNTTTDLYTAFVDPYQSSYQAPAGSLEMSLDVGNAKITSITGYRSSTENHGQDFDGTSADLYAVQRFQDYRQWSQELRIGGEFTDTFDYVVGGFFFDSSYNLTQYTKFFGFDSTLMPIDADANPQSVSGSVKSYAVFGDFNWAFAEGFRLSFGGRYTADKKELTNSFLQTGVVGSGSAKFKKFTPKIGVDYRPNSDVMIYASYQQGFRSGGFSPRAATATTASNSYQPEVVDSFELGTKLDLGVAQVNLAGFYSKYDSLQQNTTIPGGPTGNQTITGNVGSATIWGLEGDFTIKPTDGLTINGSMGYLNNNVSDFVVGNISPTTGNIVPFDYSNNQLIYNPKVTASIGATYEASLPMGELVLNTTYRFIDRYDQQISLGPLTGDLDNGPVIVNGNDPRVRSDQQNLLDASVRLNFDLGSTSRAWVAAYGRNLLDDRGPNAAFTVAGLWSFSSAREPRTYGVTLGFEY